jgi:NADPH:quinone reductase-like Zn-dependent oxidoreductase
MRAVQFNQYGDVNVLDVVEVDPPTPAEGQLLVRVKAAGINPFEVKLRRGLMKEAIPVKFPSAQGTDVAGVVEEIGPGVTEFTVGDELLGSTRSRGSQAELALVPQTSATPRPAGLRWELAGSLWVVATTAYATVAAVAPQAGDIVVVAGAAGGVGSLASQLARRSGAVVIAVAGELDHEWLRSVGLTPVAYGDGLRGRLKDAAKAAGAELTALIDTVGQGYVDLGVELGIDPQRIDTTADAPAAERVGAKTDGGSAADRAEVVAEVAGLLASGEIELPLAGSFPLEHVREAYALLEQRHPPGKIVLVP